MTRERLCWGASMGAMLGYVLAVLTSYPIRILYDPHSESWGLIDIPGQPVIAWYGWLINAALGALLGMLIVWPIRRPLPWALVWIVASLALLALGVHERHWFRH
jgi:hypothetical protein